MKTKFNLQQNSNRLQESKAERKKYIPQKVKDFARDYEAQFAELMLKEMNKATGAKDGAMASNYYKDLLMKEQAATLSKTGGGLGIQDMILDQVYPDKYRNKVQYDNYMRSQNLIRKKPQPTLKNQQIQAQNIGLKESNNE